MTRCVWQAVSADLQPADAVRAALRSLWRTADAWKLTLLEKRALV
jgi:hypothetical protein